MLPNVRENAAAAREHFNRTDSETDKFLLRNRQLTPLTARVHVDRVVVVAKPELEARDANILLDCVRGEGRVFLALFLASAGRELSLEAVAAEAGATLKQAWRKLDHGAAVMLRDAVFGEGLIKEDK
jgi:hypothetical protein